MDWRHIAFDWNQARAFLVTAEEGSLSAAARALGMAQPTLGRQVAALEQELEVTLFERAGRGLRLSPAGASLLEHVRTMGAAAHLVSLAASGQAQGSGAQVVISASEVISAFVLPPILAGLRQEHPELSIHLAASHAGAEQREADIAIRSSKPGEPELKATRLQDTAGRLYATPAYLRSIGNPSSPAELSRAEIIAFREGEQLMNGLNAMGFQLQPQNFPIQTESQLVLWELVKQGLGVGIISEQVGDAEPLVRRVLPSFVIPISAWLVAHRALYASPPVRLVFDALAQALQPVRRGAKPASRARKRR